MLSRAGKLRVNVYVQVYDEAVDEDHRKKEQVSEWELAHQKERDRFISEYDVHCSFWKQKAEDTAQQLEHASQDASGQSE